jgi:hypothetical protein
VKACDVLKARCFDKLHNTKSNGAPNLCAHILSKVESPINEH